MASFSVLGSIEKKIKENLSKILNTFENIMKVEHLFLVSKCSFAILLTNTLISKASKGIIMEKWVNLG